MAVAVLILVVLLAVNALLAMSELAVMTSRRSRLQAEAARGGKGAAAAVALSSQPTRFLSTVHLGLTLIGIFSGAFAESRLSERLAEPISRVELLAPYASSIAMVLVVLAVTYAWLVLGELVPKRLALAHPETIAGAIARPLTWISVAAALPVRVLTASTEAIVGLAGLKGHSDDVSEDDVRALVARAATTGVFTKQEYQLFDRMFRVGDLTARDLMVPRTEVVWIDEDTPTDAVRVLLGTSPYSHFPVCRGGLDTLVGVVHIKDLIAYGLLAGREFRVSAVAHQPLFVPDATPALTLLDRFRRTKTHVAFVVDEYGATLGLLTMNDLVSAVVGDVSRRGEEPPPGAKRRVDGSYLLDGRMPLAEAAHTLGLPEGTELPDVSTVAGLVMAVLGKVPSEGDRAEWNGWIVEVVDMDGTRIDKVLAARATRPGEAPPAR